MYYTLIKRIPSHIKSIIKQNNTQNIRNQFLEKLTTKQKPNKLLYRIQINNKINELPKFQIKWQSIFQEHELNWKDIFIMSYKTTIDITLRNFQFKYLHRIIATNKYLFKCKLSNSNLCDFCDENIETIEHLFWECKYIQPI